MKDSFKKEQVLVAKLQVDLQLEVDALNKMEKLAHKNDDKFLK